MGAFFAVDPRIAAFVSASACDSLVGPASPFGCTNLTGRVLSDAPSWTASIGAPVPSFTLGANGTLTPRIDYGYVSSEWATLFQNVAQNDLLAARSLLNAQLIYNRARGPSPPTAPTSTISTTSRRTSPA